VRTLLVVEERVRVGLDEGAVAAPVPASSRRAEQKSRGRPLLPICFFRFWVGSRDGQQVELAARLDRQSLLWMSEIGDRVAVQGRACEGVVRFKGKCNFDPSGTWVGVELDEAEGKNDGSVQGEAYFHCDPMRGVFVRPEKLRPSSSGGLSSYLSGVGGSSSAIPGAGRARDARPASRSRPGSGIPPRPRASVLDEEESEIERLVRGGALGGTNARPSFNRPLGAGGGAGGVNPSAALAARRASRNPGVDGGGGGGGGGADAMDEDAMLAAAIAASEDDMQAREGGAAR